MTTAARFDGDPRSAQVLGTTGTVPFNRADAERRFGFAIPDPNDRLTQATIYPDLGPKLYVPFPGYTSDTFPKTPQEIARFRGVNPNTGEVRPWDAITSLVINTAGHQNRRRELNDRLMVWGGQFGPFTEVLAGEYQIGDRIGDFDITDGVATIEPGLLAVVGEDRMGHHIERKIGVLTSADAREVKFTYTEPPTQGEMRGALRQLGNNNAAMAEFVARHTSAGEVNITLPFDRDAEVRGALDSRQAFVLRKTLDLFGKLVYVSEQKLNAATNGKA